MGGRGVWEISVSSPQSCCEPKTALKDKVYLKGKRKILSLKQVYKAPMLPHSRLIILLFSEKKEKKVDD